MFIIIQNVVVVFSQKFFQGGCEISQECKVLIVRYVNHNCYLERMLMHFLHLIEVLEGIVIYKIHI